MNIAIDIRTIGRNRTGSELVVLHITKNLVRIDTKNTYFLLTDTDDADVLSYINDALELFVLPHKEHITIVTLPAHNKFSWVAWHVWQWARKNSIDVYYTEYILPFFMPSAIKLITHIHDVSFADPETRDLIKRSDLFFLDLFIPHTIKRADHVLSASQFTKDEIIKHYTTPEEKITVVHNAVDASLVDEQTSRNTQEKVRKKYNLPQKYILSLGSMQPRKNIPRLIEAFMRIAHKIPDVHLVIAGKKAHNFDDAITQAIAKDPAIARRIMYTGYIATQDKFSVFAAAHVFAFPSLYEGFGVPILEALHTQTPTLASDIAPHHEVGGTAVSYGDPREIDHLAQKLYAICTDEELRADLKGKSAQQTQKFSWQKAAEQLFNLY